MAGADPCMRSCMHACNLCSVAQDSCFSSRFNRVGTPNHHKGLIKGDQTDLDLVYLIILLLEVLD